MAAMGQILLTRINLQMLMFNDIQLLPEIFLGISIIYLTVYGTFLAVNRKYLLIHNSVLYLSVLIISMFCFLLVNNVWIVTMSIFYFLKGDSSKNHYNQFLNIISTFNNILFQIKNYTSFHICYLIFLNSCVCLYRRLQKVCYTK